MISYYNKIGQIETVWYHSCSVVLSQIIPQQSQLQFSLIFMMTKFSTASFKCKSQKDDYSLHVFIISFSNEKQTRKTKHLQQHQHVH